MKDNTYIEKFASGEEKSKFAEFVNEEYEKNKTRILRDSLKQTKSIFIGEEDFYQDDAFWNMVFDFIVIAIIGSAFGSGFVIALAIGFVTGLCDAIITSASNCKFKGFLRLIAGLVSSPVIAIKNTVKKISEKKEHNRRLEAVKNAPVVEKKEEKPKTIEELTRDIDKSIDNYQEKWYLYDTSKNLRTFADDVKYMKKNIDKLYDESKRLDYYKRLSVWIDLFERVKRLRGSRLDEASLFLNKQLNQLCGSLEHTLTFDNISPEIKRRAQEMKIEPFYSKVRE